MKHHCDTAFSANNTELDQMLLTQFYNIKRLLKKKNFKFEGKNLSAHEAIIYTSIVTLQVNE